MLPYTILNGIFHSYQEIYMSKIDWLKINVYHKYNYFLTTVRDRLAVELVVIKKILFGYICYNRRP